MSKEQAWETRRQRQQRAETRLEDKWRGTRRQRQPRAAQNRDHEGRRAWETRRQRQPRAAQNGDHEGGQMKGHKGRQGGSGITTIWRFWGSATQSLRSKNPYSFQLSGEWRETNEEERLGAAAISVISMQGDWESPCRETNEGRQMKKGDFGNQHAGRQLKRLWFWE